MARGAIVKVLTRRFGSLPGEVMQRIDSTQDLQELEELLERALVCADLERFLGSGPTGS
jgi:hypothetical protein